MAAKILLISANRCTTPDPVFPIGLACLNAALRQAGYETRWADLQADSGSLAAALQAYRPDFAGISLRNIDDILMGKRQTFFEELSALCDTIRRTCPTCRVIVGGSGFSIFPRQLLELSGADFGIAGEGEASLVALLRALEQGKNVSEVPGLVYRDNGCIVVNPQRPLEGTLELEGPDLPPQLVQQYLRASGTLNVQTQRGCGHRCCYCTYPLLEGTRPRRRSPEVVAAEMARLAGAGARYLFIVDSVFNSSPLHVRETCEAILRRGMRVPWSCFLRPGNLDRELMRLMRQAGLAHIEFGSDSFSDPVLAAYGKGFAFEDVLHSSELAHREGIPCCHFLVCGGPGESVETLADTFVNSQRLPGSVILAVVGMRIYPGTRLQALAVKEGLVDDATDLLWPHYYVAPGLSEQEIVGQLREFARRAPNWIVGVSSPGYDRLAARLRERGVIGPLWSYWPALQQLWPAQG